jgi:seryl-tRNA synthetase
MIDIKLVRENPEYVKKKIEDRKYDINLDAVIFHDKEWRKLKEQSDALRARRNKVSIDISNAKKSGKNADELMKEAKEIPEQLAALESTMKAEEDKRDAIMKVIPNLQDDLVPVGGEESNKEIKRWGHMPKFNFPIKSHDKLLEDLGLLDMKRGAKLAGAGFYLFKGELARLERALVQFMLDFHVKDGFTEINPPQMVNPEIMYGTGNLPKFEADLYKLREGQYLIPTAEVPVTNIFAGEILEEKELPKRFCSFTQCYRTEAGRHGAETPGIFRLHQFEKVEMVYICRPEESWKMHEEMTERAEKLLQMLNLPYRRILLASGDAGFASAKTYDLEVWSPFLGRYLETSSCSNCTDFQARRMNTKYTENKSGERKFVHTLNGSGLATPRLMIALVENYQQEDGTIKVPDVLVPYIGLKVLRKIKGTLKDKNKV